MVLWSSDTLLIDDKGEVLNSIRFSHLAIPNPKVGVHGKTAVEAMKNMGVYEKVAPYIIEGKNALQTLQYIETTLKNQLDNRLGVVPV